MKITHLTSFGKLPYFASVWVASDFDAEIWVARPKKVWKPPGPGLVFDANKTNGEKEDAHNKINIHNTPMYIYLYAHSTISWLVGLSQN